MTEMRNRNPLATIERLDFMGTQRTAEEDTGSWPKPHPQTQPANTKVTAFELPCSE
jgi:hypothetical protein